MAKRSPRPADSRGEGRLREALAAYFLTAAPAEKQSREEHRQYRCALQQLADLEIQALLQSCAVSRPLRYGDLTGLLSSVLQTSMHLLRKRHDGIRCRIPDTPVCTAAEPRLITMSVVRLLRAYTDVNQHAAVKVNVSVREQSVLITVSSQKSPKEPTVMRLLHETARLHKGCVIRSGGTVAFSLRRDLSGSIGLFAVPSVEEILANPISAVKLGLA